MNREEAIEVYNGLTNTKIKEAFEFFAPELAESEDERMVKAITHILYENYTDAAVIEGVEIAEIVNWLEKQKEQKPVEWSEEDENVIETLIQALQLNAQFEFAVTKIGLNHVQTHIVLDKYRKLYLQPHWKPSEEQMLVLRQIVAYNEDTINEIGNGYAAVLESLYEQLKAL